MRNPVIIEEQKQRPDPPIDVEAHSPTSQSVTLTWEPPPFDGGCPITGYILEKIEQDGEKFERCFESLVPGLSYTLTGLTEGMEYQFRVRAENVAGVSDPSRSTPLIKAADPVEPPRVSLKGSQQYGVSLKTREEIVLDAFISGSPYPTVTWLRNDKVVKPEVIRRQDRPVLRRKKAKDAAAEPEEPYHPSLPERLSFDMSKKGESSLMIRDAIRSDHGMFVIKVENIHGVDTASCEVNVLDKPGPPVSVGFDDVRNTSVICKWEPPLDNGGSEIINYILEKKDNMKEENGWVIVTASVKGCKHLVTKLIEGKEYIFRVTAENKIGTGHPRVSAPLVAKNQFDPPDAPNMPKIVDVKANSILVSWNEPKDNGSPILGYWLERKEINSTHWTRVNRSLLSALDMRAEGLMEGLTYIFRVCAENLAGPGNFSVPTEPKTTQDPIMPPGPPIPIIVDTAKTSIDVVWDPPLYNGGGDIIGYHIEKVVVGEKDWSRSSERLCKERKFTVTGVKQGTDYIVRVFAVNNAGEGAPGMTDTVTVRDRQEPPLVDFDISVKNGVTVRAGHTLKLPALVSGRPPPEVKWAKDEGEPDKERVVIETVGKSSILTIKNVMRTDHGQYQITGSNNCGTKSALTRVDVMDVPGPVVDLKPSKVTRRAITVIWTEPVDNGGSDIIGYIVERKDANMHTWRQPLETAGCKCEIVGLLEGEEYMFRVVAKNRYGCSPPVDIGPILAVDPKGTPSAPEKLHYTERTKTTVTLSWKLPRSDGGSPIQGYYVEKRRQDGGEFEVANNQICKDLFFTVPNLSEHQMYEFRVKAVNEVGNGEPSTILDVTIQDDEAAPTVTLLKHFKGDAIIVKTGATIEIPAEVVGLPMPTIEWSKDKVVIEKPTEMLLIETEEVHRTKANTKLSIPVTMRQDKGLYTLTASNRLGEAKRIIRVEILDRPSPPRNIVVSDIRSESCYLTWDAPEDNGGSELTNYIIERRDASLKKSDWELITNSILERRYGLWKLETNGVYQFRISAENKYGISDGCESEKVELKDPFRIPGPPQKPRIISHARSSMVVTWEPPLDNGGSTIIGYVLEKRERGAVYWSRVDRGPVTKPVVKGLEYNILHLIEGAEYQFRVMACNAAGVGPPSESSECAFAVDPCYPPGMPSCPEVKGKTSNSITLAWNPPEKDGGSPIAGYIIEMLDEKSPDWKRLNSADKLHPTTEFTVPNLEKMKKYRFRVIAVNAAGESDPSSRTAEIIAMEIQEEPIVTLEVSANDLLFCHAGSTIKIPAAIKGRPTPEVSWEFDGGAKTEKKDDRHTLPVDSQIRSTDTTSTITIAECKMNHSGRYIITAKNAAGQKVVKVRVNVLDIPGPPKELKVSDIARGTCRLTWKPPDNDGGERIMSYFIEKKTVQGKAWTKVNPACGSQSFVVPDLIEGQEYLFRVRAENSLGMGKHVETIQRTRARDPILPPDPPTRVKITLVTKNMVNLTWKPPKNDGGAPVTHYIVEQLCWDPSGTQKESWRQCNRRDIEETSFRIEDLSEGGEYEFRVKAVNEAGASRPSSTAGPVITKDQKCAPNIELGEFMEVEQGADIRIVAKIKGCPFPTLTWQKAPPHKSDDKADVQYDEHINKLVFDDSCTLLIQQGKREDTGLYTITASNSLGKASKEMRLNVLGRPGPPSAPIKFEEVSAEKITLSWLPPKDDGGSTVTNYVIEKRVANRKTWLPVTNEPKERIYTVENLMEGHEYVFRIMAQNKYGIGDPLDSEPEKARNLYTVPGKCEKPTITSITHESMTVNWEEPEDDGGTPIIGYWLERKETTAKRWNRVTRDPIRVMPLGVSYNVDGLIEGSQYQFRVTAINAAGCGPPSDPSDPVFARDPMAPPGPPTPKVTDWTKSTVDVEWIPPLKDGGSKIIGYILEFKEEGKEQWEKAKDKEIRGTRFVVAGLKELGLYRFRVRAVNAAGVGEPGEVSEVIEVKDRIIAPEVDLDAAVKERIVVHAGGVIRILAYVSGKPVPQITWSREDGPVPQEAVVETTAISSALVIKQCTRKHQGIYTLTAKNEGGERKKPIIVDVLDIPGPVGAPFNTENLTSDSCKLNWFCPDDDGGSAISNYIVQKREADHKAWTSVPYTITRHSAVVHGVTRGKAYFFRVAAENAIGIGPFRETTAEIIIKDSMTAPDRPEDLDVTAVTKDYIRMTWKPPKSDGGSEVTMYILEARPIGKDKFIRLTKEKLMERRYTYDGLKEGDTYEFRVSAVNEIGQGKPSFCTKPITCRNELEPPTIELDFRDKIIMRVGDTFALQGRYTGKPAPSIIWFRDDEELKADDHIKFKNTLTTMCLGIVKAKREHSGRYCVLVENSTGSRKGICNVTVVDRPLPPEGPVVFEEVHRNHMVISWKPPIDDGGSAISNYVIEKRDANRDAWMAVTSANTKTTCKVPKLVEGKVYVMRICAENMYGISDPLDSEEMKAKDRFRVPEAPEQPDVKEVYKDSALVSWNRPRDGGKPITNYILEIKETGSKRWSRATRDPIYPDTQFRVQDLTEGCEYEFRVTAENEMGLGDPSPPSKPILAKDPIVLPGPPVLPEAVDNTKDSVSLSWRPPRHDGKGRIFGYLVEYQKVGEEAWTKANETPESCPETKLKVMSLADGELYRFRIMAVNAAGSSEPAYVKEPVKVQDRLEPPELLLHANMVRDHLSMVGSLITLSAGIRGMPFPSVTWKKNGEDVPPNAAIQVTGTGSKLEIKNCVRLDCGDYTITVENAAGSKTATCSVLVLDKPGPPRNVVVSEVTSESAYLTWKEPEDNGGAVISHYVVQKKDVASDKWVPICASCKKHSLMANYLMEGTQYLFRVAAENQFGRSEFVVTTKPIKAVDPLYPPGPPKNLHHVDAEKTEVWLEWEWPERTGGSEITGFLVDYQEEGAKDWTTFKTVSNPASHVTGLEEGKTYRFRVKAQNAIGLSRPDSTIPILCQEKLVPPSIEVDVKLIEGIVVKAGSTITLPAVMKGIPIPTAKWVTDGNEIKSEGKFKVETDGMSTVLSISECTRTDTGEYVLTVTNPAGSKTVALHATVLDVPTAPVGPVNILEVTPDHMLINWRHPKDDGGTPLTNYVVEKKDSKKPWEPWGVAGQRRQTSQKML
ncbi:hypothetical protein SKAU_G00236800 [Synaphobranchus kaupii]|uniref:Titin n=1 Tax=Synaphobranchus kaupii TaxID=118154 RepID=A0A9Q1F6S2_SYNKA|nr:hypothetical protein SKAU_G00236800 [Synaphobranchus kaupii]